MKGTTGKALKWKTACKFVRLVLMVEGKAGDEKMPENITGTNQERAFYIH